MTEPTQGRHGHVMDHVSPALIIAAHGSRAPGWAESVREFADHVAESPGVSTMFSAVEAAFLEAVPPPIPQVVSRHLKSGASSVLVAPRHGAALCARPLAVAEECRPPASR